MPLTTVFDKDAPQGRVMDLPEDFEESIDCGPEDPIEPFLARHSPLTAHAFWVWVHAPETDSSNRSRIDQNAFQRGLTQLRSCGDAVTIADVNRVAQSSGCTSGKWKVRVLEGQLEQIWGRIAHAVHSGSLVGCTGAKVSTRTTQSVRNRGVDHTVYVYLSNYLVEKSVSGLRSSLERLLFQGNGQEQAATLAQFKPDVFTYMGWGTGKMPPMISAYISLEPLCAACGKRETNGRKLKKCTACRQVAYCNVDCQKANWTTHRPECRKSSMP
ncbi:MAG: hypothetical protein SGARI_000639 [Bacillariaceae sp.]